ncbi:hypothetical protein IAG44_13650 [Streptomyces roseirectus]|uniref:Uncharacterized protein n=1 Tax=Streptomyces roseirectus TaxID=2768066 RepID=A0A7H0IC71_9ACTN|nr:hypothetical protein [Streptomyces roseirectus]QNP70387.1 hypothetical protein IAG44_13650 [Streptomyces roseirectus]
MKIRITMDGARDDVEQRSLYTWLRDDQEVRATAQVTLQSLAPAEEAEESDADTMGTALEAIGIVVDTVLQLGGLAVAIAAWRQAHTPRSTMVIERDGVKITLPADRLDDAQALLRALTEEGR